MDKQEILVRLSEHFHLELRKLTYTDQVQMSFIFRYVSRITGSQEWPVLLAEILRLQKKAIKVRSNRQKLQQLFALCQTKDIAECGRYDTNTLKAPVIIPTHNDFEY